MVARGGFMSGTVLTGTCGYSYTDWREVFYPESLSKDEYLRYYSLFFSFVELDFSWYVMPKPDSLARMGEKTGSAFRFALKMHRSLTHERGSDWRRDAAEFQRAAWPLASQGKLATLLVQFPFSFGYTTENRRYLADLSAEFAGFPLAVEFRNSAWYKDRVFNALAQRNIALVVVDKPDLPGLPPESSIATSNLGYLRFHGRNAGQWWGGDATSRYDYLYNKEELVQSIARIRQLLAQSPTVLVAFNNHARGQAVQNAKELADLIVSSTTDAVKSH